MRLPHTNHEPCCIAKKPSAAMMDGGGRRRLHCLPVEAVFGRSPLGTTSSKVEPAALAGPPAGPAFFRVRRRGQDTSRLGLPRYRRVEGSSRARTAWPALRRPQRDPNSYWFADMSLCRTIDAARMVVGRGSERAEGEPPNLREPGHLARGYVMHCGCDRKLLGVNELLENWTALGQARRRQAGVRLGDLLNQRVVMGTRWPSLLFNVASAGWKFWSSAVILPSLTSSTALLIAPQKLCPRITIALAPATLVEYSRLPMISVLTKLPATRAQNTSPMRWSKTSSGGTRESMQPTIAAKGD